MNLLTFITLRREYEVIAAAVLLLRFAADTPAERREGGEPFFYSGWYPM